MALLLKVNLDGEGDSGFFSYIVGFMTIVRACLLRACVLSVTESAGTAFRQVPIALPILIKVWLKFYGGLEAKMVRSCKCCAILALRGVRCHASHWTRLRSTC